MKIYQAVAERSGDWWAISVPELPGVFTQAKTLEKGEAMAQEAIGLMLDVPTRHITVELKAKVPDAEGVLQNLASARRRRAEATAREANNLLKAAQTLTAVMSVRDAGKVLGVSYQRVSQLANSGEPSPVKVRSKKVIGKASRRRTTV